MIDIIQEYWKAYLWFDGYQLSGVAMTLWLLVASIAIGGTLAVPLAVARVSSNPLLRMPVWFYTYVFRGTPLYIQLLILYTGIYSLQVVRDQPTLDAFFREGMNCTLLAFALNTCAYTTEIFAGAIRATPYGEIEAGRAYGMSTFTLYRFNHNCDCIFGTCIFKCLQVIVWCIGESVSHWSESYLAAISRLTGC